MFKGLLVIGVVIGLLIVVVPSIAPWSLHLAKDKVQQMDEGKQNEISDRYVIEQTGKEQGQERISCDQQGSNIELAKLKKLDMEKMSAAKEAELRSAEVFFQRSSEWIKVHTPGDTYSVNGREYSYADVVRDAALRGQKCQALQTSIDIVKQGVNALARIISNAEEILKGKRQELEQKEFELAVQGPMLVIGGEVTQQIKSVQDIVIAPFNSPDRPFQKVFRERLQNNKAVANYWERSAPNHGVTGIVQYKDEGMAANLENVHHYEGVLSATPVR